jgi:hypothetical protein
MAAFLQAVPAIIGGVGQIFAGRGASKAAGAAANVRTGAYQDARDLFRQGMDTGNQYLQGARDQAIDWSGKAADFAGGTAVDQAKASAADVSGRATSANQLLDPYATAGKGAVTQIGDLANEKFQFSQDDPSYQFRLQQGQQALERGAAAKGGLLGGGTAKALAQFGQNTASTEYQNAFNRFQDNRKTQLQALGGLANLGYGASGQQGANLIGAGEWGGNTMNQATQYAGNAGMRAAEYGGNAAMSTGTQLAGNERWGASNMADMTLGRADSIASGILGQQAGKNQMWSGLAQGLMAGAQGGLDWYNQRGNGFGPTAANMPDTSAAGNIPMSTFNTGGGFVPAPPTVNPYNPAGYNPNYDWTQQGG